MYHTSPFVVASLCSSPGFWSLAVELKLFTRNAFVRGGSYFTFCCGLSIIAALLFWSLVVELKLFTRNVFVRGESHFTLCCGVLAAGLMVAIA